MSSQQDLSGGAERIHSLTVQVVPIDSAWLLTRAHAKRESAIAERDKASRFTPTSKPWRFHTGLAADFDREAEVFEGYAELLAETAELTRALTGLTCGGSEFFIRKGDRYVADIDACVKWVRGRQMEAHRRWRDAVRSSPPPASPPLIGEEG